MGIEVGRIRSSLACDRTGSDTLARKLRTRSAWNRSSGGSLLTLRPVTTPCDVSTMWASLSSVRPTQVPFSHCVSSLRLKPGGSMGTLIITVSAKFTKADLYAVPVRDS